MAEPVCKQCEQPWSASLHWPGGAFDHLASVGEPQQGDDLTVRQQAAAIIGAVLRDPNDPTKGVDAIEALVRDEVRAAVRYVEREYIGNLGYRGPADEFENVVDRATDKRLVKLRARPR